MVLGCLLGMVPLLFPEEHRLWASRSTLEHKENNKISIVHRHTHTLWSLALTKCEVS